MKDQLVIEFPVASRINHSVLRAIAYSEVFSYPLTADEILLAMDRGSNSSNLQQDLNQLVSAGSIYKHDIYYSLNPGRENLERRLDRNERTLRFLKIARIFSYIISCFPFVRAVFLSGSITKNSMDKDSDIDYFIITEPGRLWIARTMLIMFKKIFLLNSYKYFCLNYFLASDHLEVHDKNHYVAHEIATLIPMYGSEHCRNFYSANRWIYDFLPNAAITQTAEIKSGKSRFLKAIAERLLAGRMGDRLEAYFFRITTSYWRKKFSHLRESEFQDASISMNHMNAHHPENFKLIVMERQREILAKLEREHQPN